MQETKNVISIFKEVLLENILSVPGVAKIYESMNIDGIEVHKNNLGWVININIICFFNNNIWNIVNQAQKNLRYTAEKIIKHQDYIVLNIIVHDLIEE